MRIKIHRGTAEIGGTCIEVSAEGGRILLDLGLPLNQDPENSNYHPKIEGAQEKNDLLGLLLSHGHIDHYGLAHLVSPNVPVYLGSATFRILSAAAPFVPHPYIPTVPIEFADDHSFSIGPFKVTPHLVDHSAFDAYAFTIEAEGQRIFYSGDIRAHGRKSSLFDRLLRSPPHDIDVLFLEGSSFGRIGPEDQFPTEDQVEAEFVDCFSGATGLVLVAASAQNIDRMVGLYRACKRTRRTLLIDLYTAEILRATGNSKIPQSGWPNVALYVPEYQRLQIKRHSLFHLLDRHREHRVFIEDLKELAPHGVLLFRAPMLRDLDRAECLDHAQAIWSQWDGYLKTPAGEALIAALLVRQIPLTYVHTSGHASIRDLKRLAEAIRPKSLVPIHTFGAAQFPEHFSNVMAKSDGEWWEIPA